MFLCLNSQQTQMESALRGEVGGDLPSVWEGLSLRDIKNQLTNKS